MIATISTSIQPICWTTSIADMSIIDDRYIVSRLLPNTGNMTLEQVIDDLASIRQRLGNRKMPKMMVVNKLSGTTSEVRSFYARPDATINLSAEAIVVPSKATKMMANFYLRMNQPARPTRVFNNEASALRWMEYYMEPVAF